MRSKRLTVAQARRALVQALRTTHYTFPDYHPAVRDIRIKRDRATWVEVIEGKPNDYALVFADVKDMSVVEMRSATIIHFSDTKGVLGTNEMISSDKATAMKFVDAVLTLKAAALVPGSDESDFAEFAEKAKVWRATSPRPAISDEARTYKLLAEDAFKRQDFSGAYEAYCSALEIHPMWPEGHYNAALLAAEAKDYGSAAEHMRCYLELAPNAKDAPAAKDKLLVWQHLAKQ